MTFDPYIALARFLRPTYLPPIQPPPLPNPVEYPPIQTSFALGPGFDYDPAKTDAAHHWVSAQRYVCPKRLMGKSVLDCEHPSVSPASGLWNGWENASTTTGLVSVETLVDSDVAIAGPAFTFETQGSAGTVAAMRRTVPTVPTDRFSMMLLTRTAKGYSWISDISPNPEDAAYVTLTNNEGATLALRYYKNHGEIYCGDFYDPVDTGLKWRLWHGTIGDYFTEAWPDAKKLGSGSYDITVRAGTAICGHWIGALPMNLGGLANNKLQFAQNSGLLNWRKFIVRQFNIGERQTAADCAFVSMPKSMGGQVATVQASVMLGETSQDLRAGEWNTRLNEDFQVFASATNGDQWTQVPMVVGAQRGKDVTDTTKFAYVLVGYATLNNTGNSLRWCVKFKNEYYGTLQGVQLVGFP